MKGKFVLHVPFVDCSRSMFSWSICLVLLYLTKDIFESPNYNILNSLCAYGRGCVESMNVVAWCMCGSQKTTYRIALTFNHMDSGDGIQCV